jgi:Lon-like protease
MIAVRRGYLTALILYTLYQASHEMAWLLVPFHTGFRIDWSADRIGPHLLAATCLALGLTAAGRLRQDWPKRGAALRHTASLLAAILGLLACYLLPLQDAGALGILLAWVLAVIDLTAAARRNHPANAYALVVGILLAHLLFIGLANVTLRRPGGFYQMDRIVRVEGGTPTGKVIGLIVETEQPTSITGYLLSLLHPAVETAPMLDEQTAAQQNAALVSMRTEHDKLAAAIALQYLGLGQGARLEGMGPTVLATFPEGPAHGQILPGDVITAFNGQKVSSYVALAQLASTARVGATATVSLVRGTQPLDVALTMAPSPSNPGAAYMGIQADDKYTYDIPVPVTVGGDVQGSSWSGVLALTIIDQLTPGGVLHGNVVAGTGTLGPDGSITPIGGLRQKLYIASRMGADVIFVPAAQVAEASQYGGDVPVVGVGHIREMVDWLQAHPKGRP